MHPIPNLIIRNDHFNIYNYPSVFPWKGIELLTNALTKVQYLELPFGKISLTETQNYTNSHKYPIFWNNMTCLEEIRLTHSYRDFCDDENFDLQP